MDVLSVSQLTAAIKQKLEYAFAYVTVRGEVSNLRKQASGHIYFTLKDRESQISAVLFRGNAKALSQEPKEGDQLTVKGQLSVYAPRGNYQIIVREVEYSGVGELLKTLHERKLRLEKAGWFEPSLKKPLPKLPKRIGVVTSPTGSVIQDILNVLSRRFPGFQLILSPVRVQGEGAAEEIARAIDDFSRYPLADLLIIGRGGGSLEDLWPFNELIVATAIKNSSIPIISAVGHETDFTLSDFVADVRAPTPSAAAELAILEKSNALIALKKAETRLLQSLKIRISSHQKMLEAYCKQPSLSSPYLLLSPYLQKLDEIKAMYQSHSHSLLTHYRLHLDGLIKQKEALRPSTQIVQQRRTFARRRQEFHRIMQQKISIKKERLDKLQEHLGAIDPRHLLKKGYSIVFHEKNDSVILSRSETKAGDHLRIQLSDGQVLAEVKE
ncbi:MAG: Exodeoxyribonuclease 7 large subunit [Chlamydiae bacterium]|nr:Exodeoxyribonuclease 7 large subunit [Chlamydiota bacterium]